MSEYFRLPVKLVGSSLVNFQSASRDRRSRAGTVPAAKRVAQINPPIVLRRKDFLPRRFGERNRDSPFMAGILSKFTGLAIPRTSNGKPTRKAIRTYWWGVIPKN